MIISEKGSHERSNAICVEITNETPEKLIGYYAYFFMKAKEYHRYKKR